MNFFAEQERARKTTGLLIVLLCVAVIALIAVTALAISVLLFFIQGNSSSMDAARMHATTVPQMVAQVMHSDILLGAAALIVTLVVSGSLYKLLSLGGSGAKVATALGGTLIPPNTTDFNHRKVLNVVEEMAIASGNPVPQVYVLPEQSINAFAAGLDRRSAVIAVTAGATENLTREELQGVIAHEFSHILNGDMKLNLRLVAVLHGLLLIGLAGSLLMRSSANHYGRRRDNNRGAQLSAGLILWVLGYIGVFFGSLIKAAVGRQREFLADASAVQFTRNPNGLANALKKIGGLNSQALLSSSRAEEYSHFFFGQAIVTRLGALTATHPPLSIRIKRIDKYWDGQFIRPTRPTVDTKYATPSSHSEAVSGFSEVQAPSPRHEILDIEAIGNPSHQHLITAQEVLAQIPETLLEAAREPFSARALVYALALDTVNPEHTGVQLQALHEHSDAPTLHAVESFALQLHKINSTQKLPLLECALPALQQLSHRQQAQFKAGLLALVQADRAITLLEWCFYRIVNASLAPEKSRAHLTLKQLNGDVNLLISGLLFGHNAAQSQASLAAAQALAPELNLQLVQQQALTVNALDRSVRRLSALKPLQKPQLLKIIAACIYADQKVTSLEAMVFKAVAETLNCPIPLKDFN